MKDILSSPLEDKPRIFPAHCILGKAPESEYREPQITGNTEDYPTSQGAIGRLRAQQAAEMQEQ